MGFGPLRVINEDQVLPAKGFGTHGHKNMEIITYVLSGALEHRDSIGNGSVIRYGDVQRMSAGTGVQHSEFNHSADIGVHFLQIWIEPNVNDIAPSYEEKHFETVAKHGRLLLIGSADGRDNSVLIHQDVNLYASVLNENDAPINYELANNRTAYIHLIKGKVDINDQTLSTGDALKIKDFSLLTFSKGINAELLLFDLPY